MDGFEKMNSAEAVEKELEIKSVERCSKCGIELSEGQDFCPKCGTPKGKKSICGKCGAELQEGQDFCPKCGQKVGLPVENGVPSAINQFNANVDKINAKKKTPIIIGVAILIIALVAIAGAKIVPKLFIDSEGYMAQGNYEKAYKKAKNDAERQDVIAENAAAVQSALAIKSLKDPSSFSLRDAYYNEEIEDGNSYYRLVLHISGANSYGASVSSYWVYTFSLTDKEWIYWCSVSDLEEEEYKSWDDEEDKFDKLINNLGREIIKTTLKDGIKVSKNGIKRINAMYKEDTLDEVELLDVFSDTGEDNN